jgi:hypothetical protein
MGRDLGQGQEQGAQRRGAASKRSRDFYWERLREVPVRGARLALGDGTSIEATELLDGRVPQPDGSLLYDLVSRSPLRRPGDRVRLGEIADELAAAGLSWREVGIDTRAVAGTIGELARRGRLRVERG